MSDYGLSKAPATAIRIYIAAPKAHSRAAERLALALEARGHVVTEKWWLSLRQSAERSSVYDARLPSYVARQTALRCRDGVARADLVVVLRSAGPTRGMWVELGLAIALRKVLVWVGEEPQESVFGSLVGHAFSDAQSLLRTWPLHQLLRRGTSDGGDSHVGHNNDGD